MDWQRSVLIGAILVVLYLLLLEWNQFQEQQAAIREGGKSAEELLLAPEPDLEPAETVQELPEAAAAIEPPAAEQPTRTTNADQLISVKTDVLDVVIDRRGGDLVKASLPKHLVTLKENGEGFTLLNRTASTTYIAQSGLLGANGTDSNAGRPLFRVTESEYQLAEGEGGLRVDLLLQQGDVDITKRFIFHRGEYLVDVVYLVQNHSDEAWKAGFFGQIKRDSHNPGSGNSMGVQPFLGAALRTGDENYKKLDFGDIADENFKTSITGGWVAMVQHYFISAWVPDQAQRNTFSLRQLGNKDLFALGFTSPQVQVGPGETAEIGAQFYVGPKDQYRLEEISPFLDLTVDYGWLWWLSKPLFWILMQIHSVVNNWGWAIIILTMIIKLAFFQLSATSYRSMAKMRKLQPEMLRIRELYGNDRQKLSQETMNLYRKEKVNPMGGCLPILVQMPVFLALYWVLLESVELRHAPWVFWIQDLSVKDPYFVLPLIMGLSMFVQQKLNPAPPDPTQAKIMQIMPIAFTVFFMFFPAGLVLYWTVNNVLSIVQQWVITRRIEAAG